MILPWFREWAWAQTDLRGEIGRRIFPQMAPTKFDYPYLLWNVISGESLRSLRGPSGLRYEMSQIDIVDCNYSRAKAIELMILGGQADRRLDGFSVTLGDPVYAGITVREAQWLNTRDTYDEPRNGEMQGARRIQLDFKFTFEFLPAGGTATVASLQHTEDQNAPPIVGG